MRQLKWFILAVVIVGLVQGFHQLLSQLPNQSVILNRGVFFGWIDQPLFVVLVILLGISLLYVVVRQVVGQPLVYLALGLILGGAVGNIIDRLRFGGVVDYFKVGFFPVFNLPDVAITLGVAALLWAVKTTQAPPKRRL